MKIFENISVSGKVLPLEKVRLFSDFPAEWSVQALSELTKGELVQRGETALKKTIPELPAALYRQFGRIGNRIQFENAYFERRALLCDLLYAEAAEGKGRFLDRIVDHIWATLEESTWVLPAHNPGQLCGEFTDDIHNVDLFAATTGGLMTLALHLLGERLDDGLPNHLLTRRIRHEIHRRITLPIYRYEMGWMDRYANNWNPWIFSNTLFCMTVCEDDLAWREAMLERILHRLDNFLARYGESGGCDEGPSYWEVAGGCFFDCLELIYDLTGGQLDFFSHPFVRRMGEYIMKMHICGNYFVTFADAPHKIGPHSSAMIARFGHRTGSEILERFGLSRVDSKVGAQVVLNFRIRLTHVCYRTWKDILYLDSTPSVDSFEHELCHYIDDVQIMAVRQFPQADRGLFAAIKGGCNGESHNHNDVGTFVVYYNGEPFFVDAGVDTYSRTTFSPERYTLWYMQSSYHNLPDINGVAQQEGANYRPAEVEFDAERRQLCMELRTAYPEEAGIRTFRRTLRMEDGTVRISDQFDLEGEGKVEEHYLFQECPDLSTPGVIALPSGPLVHYDARLSPVCEEVSTLTSVDLAEGQDPRGNMARNWGKDTLYRVTLTGKVSAQEEVCLVIGPEFPDNI